MKNNILHDYGLLQLFCYYPKLHNIKMQAAKFAFPELQIRIRSDESWTSEVNGFSVMSGIIQNSNCRIRNKKRPFLWYVFWGFASFTMKSINQQNFANRLNIGNFQRFIELQTLSLNDIFPKQTVSTVKKFYHSKLFDLLNQCWSTTGVFDFFWLSFQSSVLLRLQHACNDTGNSRIGDNIVKSSLQAGFKCKYINPSIYRNFLFMKRRRCSVSFLGVFNFMTSMPTDVLSCHFI